MALTPEQEAQLLADNKSLKETLARLEPVIAEVPTLKTSLTAKEAEIAELKKGQSQIDANLRNSSALTGLKSAYPDVPEATLQAALSLPSDDARKAMLEPIQKQATEFKATIAKTDPKSGWADAGSIQPATDAERLAQKEERRKEYEAHAKTGNVFGMLGERSAEIAAHVRRSLSPR